MITSIKTTYPTKKEATAIAAKLLSQKLIACANIIALESLYTWQGENHDTKEYLVELKTSKKHAKMVINTVKKLHPHSVPYICWRTEKVTRDYEHWVNQVTR